jgi:hypothetical protein
MALFNHIWLHSWRNVLFILFQGTSISNIRHNYTFYLSVKIIRLKKVNSAIKIIYMCKLWYKEEDRVKYHLYDPREIEQEEWIWNVQHKWYLHQVKKRTSDSISSVSVRYSFDASSFLPTDVLIKNSKPEQNRPKINLRQVVKYMW